MAVITKGDVKPYLNIKTTEHDAALDDLIPAAEEYTVERCGPLDQQTLTKRVMLQVSGFLVLPVLPVISVTSVTGVESGTAVAVAAIDQNLAAGLLYIGSGEAAYTVVYEAGRATLPSTLRLSVIYRTADFWRTQRGSGQRQGGEVDYGRLADRLMSRHALPGFA